MEIIYVISVLILVAGFILVKKTEKELNIISFISITIVVLLTYNAFVCYVLTFFRILSTLLNLSITNIIFSLILFGIILRKKEIQKYYLDKFSLICLGIILIAVLIVAYLNFGFPFEIKYETGDPADHYRTSVVFSEEHTLLNLYKDYIHNSFQVRKFGSYVNSGIIMDCLSNVMDTMDYYKVFISFGTFILFMTGVMMYSTLEKFTKTKVGKTLALIISLIYVMGYPLNSYLFGFEYLSLGILILGTIIHMVYYFEKEELKFPFYVIIFALLNFGVFCSYYMFVPFTYSALWIYFCIYSKRKYKKLICKKNVVMLGVTLLLPFFFGYIYHLAPIIYNILNLESYEALKNSLDYSAKVAGGLSRYGYIYANYYSNFLLLIPLALYYIYKKIKEKDYFSFDVILLIFLLLFISVLRIGQAFDKVSEYYLMKNYFALWLVMLYINFKGMIYIKDKRLPFAVTGVYIFLIVLNLIFIKAPIYIQEGNQNETLTNFVEIFGVNKTIITEKETDYTLDELEILRYVKENLDLENDSIEFLATSEQTFWEYGLLEYINHEAFLDTTMYGQDKLTLKAIVSYQKIGKVDYMVYFNKSSYYKGVEDIIFENGEVIYENEAGGIIKYNIGELEK